MLHNLYINYYSKWEYRGFLKILNGICFQCSATFLSSRYGISILSVTTDSLHQSLQMVRHKVIVRRQESNCRGEGIFAWKFTSALPPEAAIINCQVIYFFIIFFFWMRYSRHRKLQKAISNHLCNHCPEEKMLTVLSYGKYASDNF